MSVKRLLTAKVIHGQSFEFWLGLGAHIFIFTFMPVNHWHNCLGSAKRSSTDASSFTKSSETGVGQKIGSTVLLIGIPYNTCLNKGNDGHHTFTCDGVHPGRVESASPIEWSTSRIKALQAQSYFVKSVLTRSQQGRNASTIVRCHTTHPFYLIIWWPFCCN